MTKDYFAGLTEEEKKILSQCSWPRTWPSKKQLEILIDILNARLAKDFNKMVEIITNTENEDCRVIHEFIVQVLEKPSNDYITGYPETKRRNIKMSTRSEKLFQILEDHPELSELAFKLIDEQLKASEVRDHSVLYYPQNRLMELRKEMGISINELADKSGISETILCAIEKGAEILLSTKAIVCLAEILDVKPSELFLN